MDRGFFRRNTRTVAQELLGKVLVHQTTDGVMSGVIVETEAYFGPEDPASRARKRTRISEPMWHQGGHALVYMVHAFFYYGERVYLQIRGVGQISLIGQNKNC